MPSIYEPMSSFSSPAGRRDAEHRRAFSVTAAHLLTEEFVALSSEAELQRMMAEEPKEPEKHGDS